LNDEGARAGASATHDPDATIAGDVGSDLRLIVLGFLIEHPNASANEVASELRRRRRDVLRLVEALRASGVVPRPSHDPQGAGPGSHSRARCPSCGSGLLIVEERSP
jgi:hypothetical protein